MLYNSNLIGDYMIKKNQISFVKIEKLKTKQNKIKITGKFSYSDNLKTLELLCIGRKQKNVYFTDKVNWRKTSQEKTSYSFIINLDFREINNGQLWIEDIYDLYFKINNDETKLIRLGNPSFKARHFFTQTIYRSNDKILIANPYYTFKKGNLSIEIELFPLDLFRYLKKVLKWAWLIRWLLFPKNIWIIGEMPYKAQDTGFAFFKYIRKKYPEQNAFYIVDFRFPESNRVRELGNAIDFRSKKHILYIIGARRIISSHHPDYLYPSKMKSLKKKIKAKKIFLQHGVLGVKNMAGNYGNFSNGFYVDEFIASSDREKQIIVKDLHYSSKNVHVTGLSRFDELFNNNTKVKRQLLIIPTWRDWITSNQNFMETEYYNRYAQLISSERLLNLAKKYDFSIVFCLHPNMQMYTHLFQRFQNDFVKIVKQGEISVQQLLKESCLMITDYSSVAFDFSFLNKPIIYYQFDREKFLGKKGSHIDLDNELPGKICYDLTNLLNLVEEYCINNFKNPIKYKKRSEKFIKYKDQSSCDRIYKVVKNAKKNRYRFKNFLFIKVTSKLFKKLSSAI